MILDEKLEFCDATALNTGAAGSYLIGDVIDTAAARDLGGDQALYLVITVAVGIAAGSAGAVRFLLATADTDSISGTSDIIVQNGNVTTGTTTGTGTLKAGTLLAAIPLPVGPGPTNYKRYIGIIQVTGTAAITAGAVNAFLTPLPANWTAYDSPSQA